MESRDLVGEWWLPEAPGQRVAGTLAIDERGRSELRLIGALRSQLADAGPPTFGENGEVSYAFTEASIAAGGVYPRILGRVGGKAYTLDDCFRRHRTDRFFGGLGTERIHVHRVFESVWFEEDEALDFTEVIVHMRGLAYWVQRSGLTETVTFDADMAKLKQNSLTAKLVPEEGVQLFDGLHFAIGQTLSVTGDSIMERGFRQDFYGSIEGDDPTPLDDLLEHISAMQALVTIAMAQPAALTRVTLRRPDVSDERGDKSKQIPIALYAPWTVRRPDDAKPLTRSSLIFGLDHFGGLDVVARWLQVAHKNSSVLARAMSTRYVSSMYASDHLLNCAAALEGYDRDRYAKGDQATFVERIKRCIDHAGPVFAGLTPDTDQWAKRLKENRNSVAHHLLARGDASTEQVVLAQSAFWLLILCLFKDADVPGAVTERITDQSSWRWLRRNLADALQSK